MRRTVSPDRLVANHDVSSAALTGAKNHDLGRNATAL
jgi:hypothetical protein